MIGVTLNGIALLGSAPVTWAIRTGVDAPMQEFEVQIGDVNALANGNPNPAILRINPVDSSGIEGEIRGLVVIGNGPGPDPYVGVVRVTDRRFAWPYIHLGPRRYNVRRRVGVRRLKQPQGVPENDPIADDVAYHPASLKDTARPWTAREVLIDLLDAIKDREGPFGASAAGSWRINADVENVPIENLEIDDSADRALARILAYLPGLDVQVDAQGVIVVFSRIDGAERELANPQVAESVSGGHVVLVDNAAIRPQYVDVLFTREIEVRIDYDETQPTRGTDRWMENVLPVPDYSLVIPIASQYYGTSGLPVAVAEGRVREVAMGTYLTFDEALAAWNAAGTLPVLGNLTLRRIQQAMVPYLDLWAGARLAGARVPDADWMARLAAIQAHYRQTFRINRRLMDRISQVQAYRVATIDPVTGTRAPAPAFGDFCYLGSQRSMYAEAAGDNDLSYAMNVARYPSNGIIEADTKPAPCRVSIDDADQGIVRLDYLTDRFRLYDTVLPSQIELDGDDTAPGTQATRPGPSEDPRDRRRPITFDCIAAGGTARIPSLTSRHKVAVIVTVIPAYPNSEAQLFRVRIFPEYVQDLVPAFARDGLKKANGPPLQLRVGAAIETARVSWADQFATLTEAALGLVTAGGQAFDLEPLRALTINAGDQIDKRAASLWNIAKAHAAAVYGSYADHYEGAKTMPLNVRLPLLGWTGTIQHTVQPDGRTVSRVDFPGRRPTLSMFAFLDASTRRLVMRLANPGRT